MGRAKKRYYRLALKLREEHPDWEPGRAYQKAIDIDQREQAALQSDRWRGLKRPPKQRPAPDPNRVMHSGEVAVVTEDWTYTHPIYSDTNSGRKGEKFEVSFFIDADHSDSGFAFYRGTRTIGDRITEVICPADKCKRLED